MVSATPILESTATIAAAGDGPGKGLEPRISHAALLTAAQLCRGLVRMAFIVVAARSLGPEVFGVYAMLLATIEMLAVASGTGYADYLTREAAADARVGWGLASQLTRLRCISTVPLIALGLTVLWLLHYPTAILIAVSWFSATLFCRSVSEAVQGVLRGTGRYFSFLLIEIAFGVGMLGGAVVLLLGNASLRVALATEVLAAVLAAIAAISFWLRFRSSHRIHLPLRKLLKTSAIFNFYAFAGNLYDRLDVLMLSSMAGNYATGIYSTAYRPLGTVQLIPYGILYSLLPSLTRSQCSGHERKRFENAMGFLLCVGLLIVMITTAFADRVVPLVLGRRFAEAATALKILIWAVVFRYLNYALNTVLLSVRKEKIFLATTLVCLGANVLGNLVLIPIFSWRAAAAMTIVTEIVLLAQNIYWLRRTLGTVPKPVAWLSTSVVFTSLFVGSAICAKFGSPVVTGTVALMVFLAYLIYRGTFKQFAIAWGERRSPTWETINP